jgi:hypothetical protein
LTFFRWSGLWFDKPAAAGKLTTLNLSKGGMEQQDKVRRLSILLGTALGAFCGLLGFLAVVKPATGVGGNIAAGIFAGLFYFGMVFGAVIGICKSLAWAAEGFRRDPEEEAISIRRGLRRSVILLAATAGFAGAVFGSSVPYMEHRIARNDLEIFLSEQGAYQGRAYYDYMQRERLKDNYWLNLPKGQLVALCILGGLFGGAAGAFGLWFGYRLIEQFILNFFAYGGGA